MRKWFCSCNAVNAEFANYCHNCQATRFLATGKEMSNGSIYDKHIDISEKYMDMIEELKQQIQDAEEVIKVYDELMLTYKSYPSEVAKKYWSRYERKE